MIYRNELFGIFLTLALVSLVFLVLSFILGRVLVCLLFFLCIGVSSYIAFSKDTLSYVDEKELKKR